MRIGLLEDDPQLGKLFSLWLEEAGHSCVLFTTGREFKKSIGRESYDLLVLDWTLPDITGDQALAWAREQIDWRVPIIFVTVRDRVEDIVRGLELGADDYIAKPVERSEMLARITAVLRRTAGSLSQRGERLDCEPYQIDLERRTITCAGRAVELTTKEFELAVFLFRNAGRPLSRAHILNSVWGGVGDISTRTVDTHVSRLRRKLEIEPRHGWRLSGIYHYGYRLEASSIPAPGVH